MTHYGLPSTTPTDGLAVEHEIQRLMLQRLGIEWTPGEPFYSLVEAEIERLQRALGTEVEMGVVRFKEIERLRAALRNVIVLQHAELHSRAATWEACNQTTCAVVRETLDRHKAN